MLPWFIYILIQLALLQTPEEWNTLTPAQKQQYEIIISDMPMTGLHIAAPPGKLLI